MPFVIESVLKLFFCFFVNFILSVALQLRTLINMKYNIIRHFYFAVSGPDLAFRELSIVMSSSLFPRTMLIDHNFKTHE